MMHLQGCFWAECSVEDKRYQLATGDKNSSILCNCVLQFVAVEETYSPDGLLSSSFINKKKRKKNKQVVFDASKATFLSLLQ